MVYQPDPGAPDPGYELEKAQLYRPEKVEELLEQLRSKKWIQPEDLTTLATAASEIFRSAGFVDEELLAAPPIMREDDYYHKLGEEWHKFLNEADPSNESVFQEFLEQHPSLLPGPHGTPHGRYHGPLFGSVFTQPELPGFRAKRPDFLLFEQDSATVYAVLIEIEAPKKPWCTKSGISSAELKNAINQLHDWKVWFSEPAHVIEFRNLYRINEHLHGRRLKQHYVLIYGRREDARRIEAFAKKRTHLQGPEEFFMTYDRLQPNLGAYYTLRLDRSGPDTRLRVVSVPPDLSLTKSNARWFSSLLGREEAIQSNRFMTDARKAFLLKRLRHADAYARKHPGSAPVEWLGWQRASPGEWGEYSDR